MSTHSGRTFIDSFEKFFQSQIKTKSRGIHHYYQQKIQELISGYEAKIAELSERLFSTTCYLSEFSAPNVQPITPNLPMTQNYVDILTDEPDYSQTLSDEFSETAQQQDIPQTTSDDISDYDIYEEEYCCIRNSYFMETLEPKKDVLSQYLKTDQFHETISAHKTLPPPLVKNLKISSAIPDINSKDLEIVISNFNRSWSIETTENNGYKDPRRKKTRCRCFKRTNL